MTRRVRLLFRDRPPRAPHTAWIAEGTDLDQLAERIPGVVGYVDLERGEVRVQEDALTKAEIEAQIKGWAPGGPAPAHEVQPPDA